MQSQGQAVDFLDETTLLRYFHRNLMMYTLILHVSKEEGISLMKITRVVFLRRKNLFFMEKKFYEQ